MNNGIRPRNAVTALAFFVLNELLIARLDQPLMERANGEPKPDLRFGYDLATVQRRMDSYGAEGRSLYTWNPIADTPFLIFGAIAVSLFALVAFPDRFWQILFILPPLVFGTTDLIEKALFHSIVLRYPSFPPALVSVTSVIMPVKRAAYCTSMLVLIFSLLSIAMMQVKRQPISTSLG